MNNNIHPWQQKQWQLLTARLENKSFPHALLFIGPAGSGKSQFALSLAELLLQPSSHLLEAGTHPDFLLIQPEEKSKTIKIEQIRAIKDMLSNKSHQGGYQVVIINPADAMPVTAANALLKTLEEPPGQVVLMLTTDRPSALPATILSRCQQVKFYLPANIELSAPDRVQQRENFFNSLQQLLQNKIDPIQFAESCQDLELRDSLQYLQLWLVNLIKTNLTGTAASYVDNDRLFKCLDKTIAAVRTLANNLNKQLVLEDIGVELVC